MKKFLLAAFLYLLTTNAFAQRFAQYYTNTLYDSFENPSQKVFTPDSSKTFAFNFLVPNINVNASLTGNAQAAVRQYIFLNGSNNPNLLYGQNNINHLYTHNNVYIGMFKIYTSLNGDQEVGFSAQIKGEGEAKFTDETVGLFQGGSDFSNTRYSNILNDNYWYQAYHQLSITYRKTLNKQFSFGLKLSALSGIVHDDSYISSSNITFEREKNQLLLTLTGRNRSTYDPGTFDAHNFIPNFSSPGLAFSLGIGQHTEGGLHFQYNLKDLGFIRWNSSSNVHNFNNTAIVPGINTAEAGQNLYSAGLAIFKQNGTKQAFTTPTDGRFEVSASKQFWLNDQKTYKYTPVVVVSKQLFYRGIVGVFTNNVQYRNLVLGVTNALDNYGQFNLGGQVMIKSPNAEFFIGSEQLLQSYRVLRDLKASNAYINRQTASTGASFYIGFALKFGPDINTHENASYIPSGEDGSLIRRIFHGIF